MSRARLAAGLWAACVVVALYWASANVAVRNDMTSFMPRAATPTQRLLMNEMREGPLARLTIVTLGGADRDTLAEQSRRLAAQRRASGGFVRVANGEGLFDDAERQRLFTYRYLLSPGVDAERFTVGHLRAALRQRLRELASPVPTLDRQWLAEDPTAEMRTLLGVWRGPARPRTPRGVWFEPHGARALLLAETRAPGYDLDAQEAAQDMIRHAAATAGAAALDMSGPGVFAVASRAIIRADTRRLGLMAGAAAIAILLLGYRSARLLVAGALPLVSAVAAGIVAVSALFGTVHGIVLAFGVTVIGVAIDYPIHLFSHLDARRDVRASLADVWPTIRLGAVTTAVGYTAMVGTDFPGLTQLAAFAVAGLLAAAACTRLGLAGWLPERYAPRRRTPVSDRFARAPRPGRPWKGLVIAAGVAALGYLLSRDGPPFEDDLGAIAPVPESVMARDRHLHAELGVPDTNHVLLLEAPDAQGALEASESITAGLQELVERGVIAGFDVPSRYLPSVATQRARQRRLPDADRLRADVAEARDGTPFREDAFAPFVAAVAASRTLAPLTPGDLDGTTLGLRLRSSLLPVDGARAALVTLYGVRDAGALTAFVDGLGMENLSHLDLKRDTRELMADFRRNAAARVLWGLAAIVLVLLVGLRDAGRTLRVLAPGLLAVLIDVAILRLAGERLTLFHLVSLLLVVGISIDYGLFFSRREAGADMRARTFHGLCICVLSTVMVFGILATSRLPVLNGIGTTVAVGVAVSFVAAMLLSPPASHRDPVRA